MRYSLAWEFCTPRFRVALEISPEEMDPADSFEFEEDIEAVRSGRVEWFCARVVVYLDEIEVGSSALGGCAYETVREFFTSHRDPNPMHRNCSIMRAVPGKERTSICHYFPGMVREAIADARATIARRKLAYATIHA